MSIAKQRYLNLLVEMSKTSKFIPSKILEQFKVSLSILPVLKELKLIKQIESDGRKHCYSWISITPTLKDAEKVLYFVNKGMKEYQTNGVKAKPKPVVQTTQMIVKPNLIVLTDEMCIEHLKNSKEFKYEIYKVVREQL